MVVQGGVFVLADGELWFTDLERVRGTGQTGVTQVRLSADARQLAVMDTRSGHPLEQGYDTRTGRALRGQVRPGRLTRCAPDPGATRSTPVRVAPRSSTPALVDRVPMTGLPSTFVLGAWSGDSVFYGVAGSGGHRSVVGCDVARDRCAVKGAISGPDPVLFGTGQ